MRAFRKRYKANVNLVTDIREGKKFAGQRYPEVFVVGAQLGFATSFMA